MAPNDDDEVPPVRPFYYCTCPSMKRAVRESTHQKAWFCPDCRGLRLQPDPANPPTNGRPYGEEE